MLKDRETPIISEAILSSDPSALEPYKDLLPLSTQQQCSYLENVTGFNRNSYEIAEAVTVAYYKLVSASLSKSGYVPAALENYIFKMLAAAKYKVLKTIESEEIIADEKM